MLRIYNILCCGNPNLLLGISLFLLTLKVPSETKFKTKHLETDTNFLFSSNFSTASFLFILTFYYKILH